MVLCESETQAQLFTTKFSDTDAKTSPAYCKRNGYTAQYQHTPNYLLEVIFQSLHLYLFICLIQQDNENSDTQLHFVESSESPQDVTTIQSSHKCQYKIPRKTVPLLT